MNVYLEVITWVSLGLAIGMVGTARPSAASLTAFGAVALLTGTTARIIGASAYNYNDIDPLAIVVTALVAIGLALVNHASERSPTAASQPMPSAGEPIPSSRGL